MKQNVLVEIKLSIFGNIALAAARGFSPPINQLSEYRKTGTFKLLACTVPTSLPKRTVLFLAPKRQQLTTSIYCGVRNVV